MNFYRRFLGINKKNDYLINVRSRGAAANSDHYFFYENNVKCFFIYTEGEYSEYHNILDKAESVPLVEFEDLTRLMIRFVESYR